MKQIEQENKNSAFIKLGFARSPCKAQLQVITTKVCYIGAQLYEFADLTFALYCTDIIHDYILSKYHLGE